MNNNNFLRLIVVLFLAMSILSSCGKEDIDETIITETETVTFDCDDLELNIGEACIVDSLSVDGTVTDDCECKQCPTLSLNTGDACTTASGAEGFVNSTCECQPTGPTFDCISLSLNIGDDCVVDSLLVDGTITDNCECKQCPTLNSNVGYPCTTDSGEEGYVNPNCECQPINVTYDCPNLSLNVGDACYDAQGNEGTVDNNCDCVVSGSVDCPSWGLDVGDECSFWDIDPVSMDTIQVQGVLDSNCNCDVQSSVDCPSWGLDIGDECSFWDIDPITFDTIQVQGVLDINCQCL